LPSDGQEGVPPSVAADRLAERRMAEARRRHGGATPPLLPALR
jgi:hypothetical protein